MPRPYSKSVKVSFTPNRKERNPIETYKLQCALGYLGYPVGAIDGEYGKITAAAVAAFQRDFGLEADGRAEEQTCQKIVEALAGAEKQKTFWDEIEFFTREEFRCKCAGRYCSGYPAEMQEDVVRIADAARKHFGRPGHVVSGLRCPEWNRHEGGVANSQHQYGEAIDLRIEGVAAPRLQAFVSAQPTHRYSYCINDTNVHFDIPARR